MENLQEIQGITELLFCKDVDSQNLGIELTKSLNLRNEILEILNEKVFFECLGLKNTGIEIEDFKSFGSWHVHFFYKNSKMKGKHKYDDCEQQAFCLPLCRMRNALKRK